MGNDPETYTLFLEVPDETLAEMIQFKWKLCIAKQVVESTSAPVSNVVWKAIEQVIPKNEIEFSTKYQVYGSTKFTPGARVELVTSPVQAMDGQIVICKDNSLMQQASGPVTPGKPIQVKNEYKEMNLGLHMFDSKNSGFSPIYSSPGPHPANGVIAYLTPKLVYEFWLDPYLETGMMYEHAANVVGTADFTKSTEPQTWKWSPKPKQPLTGNWDPVQ